MDVKTSFLNWIWMRQNIYDDHRKVFQVSGDAMFINLKRP